jgi:hypothetical protein
MKNNSIVDDLAGLLVGWIVQDNASAFFLLRERRFFL